MLISIYIPIMDTEVEKKPKNFLKEKILRFKLVVFVRRNIVLFTLLFLFLLTLLLGLWNINKYEVFSIKGEGIQESVSSEIGKYFEANILGTNYFLSSPTDFQKDMYLEIAYLSSIKIEKIVPNKLVMFVDVFNTEYVAKLKSNSCFLLSQQGVVLEEICVDDNGECCINYAKESNLPLFLSNDVDISYFEDGKSKLLIMEDISKVFRIVDTFKFDIVEMILANDILELHDTDEKIFRFSMRDDIDTQIRRYIVVMGKIRSDNMEFQTLDLRFERPVMSN